MNESVTSNVACPNCGTINDLNARSCISCGFSLQPQQSGMEQTINNGMNVANQPINNVVNNGINMQNQQINTPQNNDMNISNYNSSQPVENNAVVNNNQTSSSGGSMSSFSYILGVMFNPCESFGSMESKLDNPKSSIILWLIVVGIMIIKNILSLVISVFNLKSSSANAAEYIIEYLKSIKYLRVIGSYLLLYGGALLAIALVYFIATRLIKKNISYFKLLGAVTTSFIPIMVTSIIAPLLSKIYNPLETIITIVGIIYSFIILVQLTNLLMYDESEDTIVHVQLVCLSIIIIGGGWILYKLMVSALSFLITSLISGI